MDSAVLGTLVGGAVTLAGTLLANYLNLRKEQAQWQRQQESEQRKWARDEQQSLRQELYDIYCNCLRQLSLVLAECHVNPGEPIDTGEVFIDDEARECVVSKYRRVSINEEERLCRQEAQKWLWLLLLHLKSNTADTAPFEYDLRMFQQGFGSHLPERLLEHVLAFAKNDRRLSGPA